MKYVLLALMMSLLLLKSGIAQDDILSNQLEDVVITAQYAPQSDKNAVYKVKVINEMTIQKKAAVNLRELLLQELNLDLTQNSVFGTSIQLQGISKENIKILIDGVPIIGRLNGIIDMNQINLSNIQRVEIIEGPVSVFYGTDAMGGVINLVSKKWQENKVDGNLTAYYESITALKLDASLGYKFKHSNIRLSGGLYQFDGASTDDAPRNINWEKRKQYHSELQFGTQLLGMKLRYNGRFSNEKLFHLGEPNRRGKIKDQNYFTTRFDNNINLNGYIFDNKYLDVTLSKLNYQRYHTTYDVDPITYEATLSEKDQKEDNIVKYQYNGIKAQLGQNKQESKLNYAVGIDLFKEITEGERILDNRQDISTYALLSSLNYKINKLELQPGARWTLNSSYGTFLSPSFNSIYKFDSNNNIRFSYARGFRAPSLKELFLDFHISAGPNTFIISGNEQLEVEKSHSFNILYSYQKQLANDGSLAIEPSLFYNEITDLITLSELVDFKRHYINIDKFKSVGGKINVKYNPNSVLSLHMGIAITGRYNKFNESFDTQEFLYSPEVVSSIDYRWEKLGLNMNLFHKYSGERDGFIIGEQSDQLVQTTRGDFHHLDATVSKSFFNHKMTMSIGVKNIFDVTDIETINEAGQAHARDQQLWGRSFFVKSVVHL